MGGQPSQDKRVYFLPGTVPFLPARQAGPASSGPGPRAGGHGCLRKGPLNSSTLEPAQTPWLPCPAPCSQLASSPALGTRLLLQAFLGHLTARLLIRPCTCLHLGPPSPWQTDLPVSVFISLSTVVIIVFRTGTRIKKPPTCAPTGSPWGAGWRGCRLCARTPPHWAGSSRAEPKSVLWSLPGPSSELDGRTRGSVSTIVKYAMLGRVGIGLSLGLQS